MAPNSNTLDGFIAGDPGPSRNAPQHKTIAAVANNPEDGPNNPFTQKPLSPNYFELLEKRRKLPVHAQRGRFLQMYQNSQLLICEGDSGTGKTTQIPQFVLLNNLPKGRKHKQVACTQPRRIAAVSAAQRVSEEMDVRLGEEVGYKIRFDDKTSNRTLLKYMTDGMLLREAISDSDLDSYDTIIIDEAHERTVATDMLMTLLKDLIKRRNDIRVIIMSATLNTAKFTKYFNNAPLLSLPERTYPVEIFYTMTPQKSYFEAAVQTVLSIHESEPEGDILLFLTGDEEIEEACRKIPVEVDMMSRKLDIGRLVCFPLYRTLSPSEQYKVFENDSEFSRAESRRFRKCIIATNIAESSLTIDGIVYIVDPGFSKQKVYNPRIRVESLLVSPISKASAYQRAGRAGRTRSGRCFRLYTEESFKKELNEQDYPEILRSNLSSTVLTLKRFGIEDLVHFDFMDPPAPETLVAALEELISLACLDEEGELTELGRLSSEFPLDPALAVMLISSPQFHCSNEILSIASLLSAPQTFMRPAKNFRNIDRTKTLFAHRGSDHITLLNVYHAFKGHVAQLDPEQWCYDHNVNYGSLLEVDNIRSQLKHIMDSEGIQLLSTSHTHKDYYTNIRRALMSGFFTQVARRFSHRKEYKTLNNQIVSLHPSSVLSSESEWVVYNECILTKKTYIRTVTAIEPTWLLDTGR